MVEPFKVSLITQERVLYEGKVNSVVAPAVNGQLGILTRHAPLMAALGNGVLKMRAGSEKSYYAVFGGFIQMKDNHLILLADRAIQATELDQALAEEELALLVSKLESGSLKGAEKRSLIREIDEARVKSKTAALAAEESR